MRREGNLKQTHPSSQRSILGPNLLAKEKPMFNSVLLRLGDVMIYEMSASTETLSRYHRKSMLRKSLDIFHRMNEFIQTQTLS